MAYLQVANSRGGKILILDQFRYVRNKAHNDKIYWRCATMGCKVYLHTNNFNVQAQDPAIAVLRPPGLHDHLPESDLVATTALIERMLGMVADDLTRPIKRIYDEVIDEYA